MRILADLATNSILQVEKTPEEGELVSINGKYVIDVPENSNVEVDSNSYILNGGIVDSGSVVYQSFSNLLAQFPMHDNILFNPLIIADDVNDLDLSATFPGSSIFSTRAQTGRASVDPQEGLAPNATALLPINDKVSPSRPGLLITDTIDLTAATGGAGAKDFTVYWKLYDFNTSTDISSDFGITSGQNDPAIKSIVEVDQEPVGLEVYISSDDGASYKQVGLLEPISFCENSNSIRIAFKNESNQKIYLSSYAVMF
jgi:hypothetical protein